MYVAGNVTASLEVYSVSMRYQRWLHIPANDSTTILSKTLNNDTNIHIISTNKEAEQQLHTVGNIYLSAVWQPFVQCTEHAC